MSAPTLAQLGIVIENGQVIKATASLDKMTVAGTKTEAAAQRLTRRMALLEIQAREMDGAMGHMHPTVAKLGAAFAAFSALAVVGFIGHKAIEETIAAQDAMAQLEAAVTSTGGAAGRTVAQLDALSIQLQKQTTFSDEAVKGDEKLLLTFDKIRGVEFDRATRAVTDLATRMGGDLQAAAIQVGKALQDPEHGLTALRRSGVSFSAVQIDVIKKLYETGQVAEGQRVILKELEHQFGGSAAAARDTLGGALSGLKNAWGDLFEVTRGGSQGSVDAINAITKSLEDGGLSMNTFVTNTVVGWNNISAAVQKAKNWMAVDLSQGLGAAIEEVNKLNAKVEEGRLAANARARSPGKIGPALGGVGGLGPVETQAMIDAAKKQHEANVDLIRDAEQMAEIAGLDAKVQERARIEYEAINKAILARRAAALNPALQGKLLDETLAAIEKEKGLKTLGLDRNLLRDELKGAQQDIEQFMAQVTSNSLQSWTAFFDSVSALAGKLMAHLKTLSKEGTSTYTALGAAQIAIAGGAAGYETGQSLYSSSHSGGGNTVRGALGGAASAAAMGAMLGSIVPGIGTAIGAIIGGATGFIGGVLGMGSAAKAAAKAITEATKQVALSMDALRASVHGETLAQGIAQIEAARAAGNKAIEEAWSGGDANSDRVRWRTQQHKELNALEDEAIAKLQQEYALRQARAYEDLKVRDLASQGRTEEARALALQLAQERERQDMIKSFGETIDPTEAATLALLDQVQAQEALAAATNAASGAALNMVQGYKLQATIFGAMTARSGAFTAPNALSPPVRSGASGDLAVTVMMPSGEVLGKVVIKDFARRQRLGDSELSTVLS